MDRKMRQRGLSLIELIIAMTLLGGVMLMMATVRFDTLRLLNMGMNQAALSLNTQLALERIVNDIHPSNYLEIDTANNALTLSTKNDKGIYIQSRYSLEGGNLCYQADLSLVPLPTPEIILRSISDFTLEGLPLGGGRSLSGSPHSS